LLQRERDRRRRVDDLAKRNASELIFSESSGLYRIVPATSEDLAKRNAWTVRITVLSKGSEAAEVAGGILQKGTG